MPVMHFISAYVIDIGCNSKELKLNQPVYPRNSLYMAVILFLFQVDNSKCHFESFPLSFEVEVVDSCRPTNYTSSTPISGIFINYSPVSWSDANRPPCIK
jgi:hypothetical protein